MKSTNWHNISYLEDGTEIQKSAFITLKKHRILEHLSPFDPVLVSTVCVNLDSDGSDLDIICQHKDLGEFRSMVNGVFKTNQNYRQRLRTPDNEEVVVSFLADKFEIEISVHEYQWKNSLHSGICP